MPNATIGGHQGTKIGSFNLTVSFDSEVEGFDNTDVNLVYLGDTDPNFISYNVTGMGDSYNITFRLVDDHAGSFRVELTGMVSVSGVMEAIVATAVTVQFNTHSSISAGFGTPRYTKDSITVGIAFDEGVSYFHKTDCEVVRVAGDEVFDFQYFLTQPDETDDENFELVFLPSLNKQGIFSVDITGYVFHVSGSVHENVEITPVLVPFNSTVPQIVDSEKPEELSPGVWDYFIELNAPMLGIGIGEFIYEGENPGTPTLYLGVDLDVRPALPPEPLNVDRQPDCFNGWQMDSTGNSMIPAKYVLLRFNIAQGQTGPLEIGLREVNSIRAAV